MGIKKVIIFIMCLVLGTGVQAAALQPNSLKPITRQESRLLLEETIGRVLSKPELVTRPNDAITREEMALMIVNILGYEDIVNKLKSEPNTFKDVKNSVGAINLVKSLKLISGDSNNNFSPHKVLTAAEVATIIKRIEDRLSIPIDELHSSYAIRSSDQMTLIKNLDAVSFGWSQVEYDQLNDKVIINTTSSNQNDFSVPLGFEIPLAFAKQENAETYLMVYLNDRPINFINVEKPMTLATYIFNNQAERASLIQQILSASQQISQNGKVAEFDGVTIDFEDFYDDSLKSGFNTFLKELKQELNKNNKKLNVAVQPNDYYKGYDYKTIGQIADRVILMAHDYGAKTLSDAEMQLGFSVTPITPIHAIYKVLKEITDNDVGTDPSKVMLQVSFASTQWQVKDNKIIHRKPYTPSYDKLFTRLQNKSTEIVYSNIYQNPYAIYYEGDIKNVIWYENEQSIQAKIDLAKMFGINKISLWRLGTIPNYTDVSNKNIQLDIVTQLSLGD